MKIIINVMLLLPTEKKRENISVAFGEVYQGKPTKRWEEGKKGARGMILESNALR